MDVDTALRFFLSLSQETRLRVFMILIEYGETGVAAGVIGERLEIAHNTLSFHLSHLSKSNLVTSHKEGRSIIYKANCGAIQDIIGFLRKNCCVKETTRPEDGVSSRECF